jgi:hypothetical protein
MSTEIKLTQNPIISQAEEVDPALEKAKNIYNKLQDDIQKYLIEEYINPQLQGDDLVKEFEKQLMSEECNNLQWQVLTNVVSKIIENKSALEKIIKKYDNKLGFKECYEQHFIKNIMTFKGRLWHNKPLESMCADLTLRMWH